MKYNVIMKSFLTPNGDIVPDVTAQINGVAGSVGEAIAHIEDAVQTTYSVIGDVPGIRIRKVDGGPGELHVVVEIDDTTIALFDAIPLIQMADDIEPSVGSFVVPGKLALN